MTAAPGRSRLETNLRRLLARCEIMAKENQSSDWRFLTFIGNLDDMLKELQQSQNAPSQEMFSSYLRRIDFLKGLMDTNKLTTPSEKILASKLLSPVPDSISKETHQKAVSKYTKEIREELLDTEREQLLRQRHTMASSEDMDTLLKNNHNMHEKIAENMLSLAKNMKEKSQIAGEILKRDIETVNKSARQAEKNFDQLRVESERLQEHSRRAWRCWMWVMIIVVIIIFISKLRTLLQTVNKSSHQAEKNFDQLRVESERLQEHSRRAWRCWMWVMIIVVIVIFINMVLFMKVTKKRRY